MIQEKKLICKICGQEQNLTLDNEKECLKCGYIEPKMIYQIVIEGDNEEEVQELFEEIQNKYKLFDNCVIQSVPLEDSIIDEDDRKEETGRLTIKRD